MSGAEPAGPPPGPLGPPSGPVGPVGPPTDPYGASPPPPPPGDGGRRKRWPFVVLAAVLVALLGVGVGVVVGLVGDDEAGASEVFLEPAGSSLENPFMPSVGEDDPDVEPVEDAGGAFDGDTVGLYGGTRDDRTCDRDQLVAFLEANPAEADAWAGVLDIEVGDIASFVDGLTPLVLRSDTAVTNHGFRDGEATTIPAVLQAGTAVLVDARGRPVVKCSCGNPLTPPTQTTDVDYVGSRWDRFAPDQVTVVQQVEVDVDVFVVVDVDTDEAFSRPPGTDGDDDGPPPDDLGGDTTTTEQETTSTTEGVPTEATYEATVTSSCFGTTATAPVTAQVSGGTITITGEGGSASGPVDADGSFTVTDVATVSGTLDAETITGSVSGEGCTGTLEGTRTG